MQFKKRSKGSNESLDSKTDNKDTKGQKFWREWKEAHDALFFDAVSSAKDTDDLTIEDYTDTLREEAWKLSEKKGTQSYRNGQGAGFAKARAAKSKR